MVPGAIAELFSRCDAGVELFQHLLSFCMAGNLTELVAKTRLDVVQLGMEMTDESRSEDCLLVPFGTRET